MQVVGVAEPRDFHRSHVAERCASCRARGPSGTAPASDSAGLTAFWPGQLWYCVKYAVQVVDRAGCKGAAGRLRCHRHPGPQHRPRPPGSARGQASHSNPAGLDARRSGRGLRRQGVRARPSLESPARPVLPGFAPAPTRPDPTPPRSYHILLEKPMANTEAECHRIYKAVTQAGVIFAVCHVLRYTPCAFIRLVWRPSPPPHCP